MVNWSELQTVTPSPDFIAAIKDTQSIAATVSRRSLLEKALSAAMNHTGAHSGRLLLADGGRLAVAASYDFEPPVTVIHPPVPLSAANDIPRQVIDHAVQTRQRILLTARTGYGNFATDPYFRLNQPASLLCVPLKWDTRVEGTLYLEGGTFVFSEVQVQTAEMLAAQTAIALINIQRHEELRQKAEEQQRAEEMLRVISAGTAAVTGEDFFRSLVLHLIEVLHVHSAFITECTDETMERVRTLVFWNDNSFTDNIEYDLEDTTCEGVIAGSVCYYSARVYELFPKEEGVESYLGVPVHNSAGEILGHLAIYDIKPMPEQLEPYKLAILQIFAARAGAELDRIRALDALYQAKEGLEIRVMERTAELTGINARLQGEIVERERAEAALRQSEEAYRDLYEEAPNAYLSVGVDRRIRKANRQAVTYFGYPLSELLDRHILDLIADTPAGRPVSQGIYERLMAGQETLGEELEFRRADGTQLFTNVWVRPLRNAQGEIEATRSIIVDVTERKRMEEERERLIEELDAFAHTVAHDLKNPLTGVIACTELLETDWVENTDRVKAVRNIARSSRKMSNIIQELLILAEMRQLEELAQQPLDMARIVREARYRLQHQIDAQEAVIELPAEWPIALGHAPWVEEVWANYLSNGLKYGGRPPRLALGGELRRDGQAQFWVRDNGNGLAADELERLFKPFTRLNQIHVSGHGLGLSIVQRLVQRLGGQVGVESQPGRGATFFFTLPAADDIPQAQSSSTSQIAAG